MGLVEEDHHYGAASHCPLKARDPQMTPHCEQAALAAGYSKVGFHTIGGPDLNWGGPPPYNVI